MVLLLLFCGMFGEVLLVVLYMFGRTLLGIYWELNCFNLGESFITTSISCLLLVCINY